jgi:hypothetical protein
MIQDLSNFKVDTLLVNEILQILCRTPQQLIF